MILAPIDPLIQLPTVKPQTVTPIKINDLHIGFIAKKIEQRRFYLLTQEGAPVLEWTASFSYDDNNTSYIVDDPIEGGFTSHDKVRSPLTCSIFAVVTDSDKRRTFLEQAQKAVDDVTLYQLVTPDITHENLSIIGVSGYRTPDNFYSSVGVTFKLREVRLNGNTRVDKTAEPTAAPQSHAGQVTPVQLDPTFLSLDIPK